jgi:hypothetical protein
MKSSTYECKKNKKDVDNPSYLWSNGHEGWGEKEAPTGERREILNGD